MSFNRRIEEIKKILLDKNIKKPKYLFELKRLFRYSLESELSYRLIHSLDNYYLLEVYPKTGRHHQIRTQLGFIGYPIKGDLKYNSKRSNPDSSIDLHARSLTICHPTTKEIINIVANPPIKPQWNFALSD